MDYVTMYIYRESRQRNKISLTSSRKLPHLDEIRAKGVLEKEEASRILSICMYDMYVHQVSSLPLPGLISHNGAIRIETI